MQLSVNTLGEPVALERTNEVVGEAFELQLLDEERLAFTHIDLDDAVGGERPGVGD